MQGLAPTAVIALAAAFYVLPGLIAVARGRRHQWAILALDLLTGWTIVGWIGALIWACRPPSGRRKIADPTSPHANDNTGDNDETGELNGGADLAGSQTPAKIPFEPPRLDPYADWLEDGVASAQDTPSERPGDPRGRAGGITAA